jgi:hypothetical protein
MTKPRPKRKPSAREKPSVLVEAHTAREIRTAVDDLLNEGRADFWTLLRQDNRGSMGVRISGNKLAALILALRRPGGPS